jgi:predicted dehydrogenase
VTPPTAALDYKPHFPAGHCPGIGIIGCGGIVKSAHLPAYRQYKLNVVGVYDVNPAATQDVQARFGVPRVFDSLDDLLACPDIQVVDIATHPAQRAPLMHKALQAGKHILAQKPLALDVGEARTIVTEAQARGLKVAVNQNGRWAPPWRVATLLIQHGAIGQVFSVSHLFDLNFGWITGTVFDSVPHFALYDYAVHWVDITRCWMGDTALQAVRARDFRLSHQPAQSKANWGMWIDIAYAGGANASIRAVGGAITRQSGHPFWIHGTAGTIRGSVLNAAPSQDYVELERDGVVQRYQLQGQWFNDGFGGTMGELLCAIAEDREPYNSARHNLLSLQMTLAACKSADQDGQPVVIEEVLA